MSGGEGHAHVFDPVSGYCGRCGFRNDGRLVDKSGTVYRHAHGVIPARDEQRITEIIRTMKGKP